jgi:hypothetical protein
MFHENKPTLLDTAPNPEATKSGTFNRNGQTLNIVRYYREKNLSVIVINDRKQAVSSWKEAQQKPLTENQIEEDLKRSNAAGIAAVCGAVSGNLEVLDIDCKYDLTGKLHELLFQFIKENDPELFDRLLIFQTPTKGYHIYYRCEYIQGNQKLAFRPTTEQEREETYKKTFEAEIAKGTDEETSVKRAQKAKQGDKKRVLIETRGEAGYVAALPTPGYSVYQKNDIPVISTDDRDFLISLCRSFNECIEETVQPKASKGTENGYAVTPWDDYNNRCTSDDISDLLAGDGWTIVRKTGSHIYLRRPGKTKGVSADIETGKKRFRCHSTSSDFDTEHAYTPSGVLTQVQFSGDFKKCLVWLSEKGYGIRAEPAKEKKEKLEAVAIESLVDWLHSKYKLRRNARSRYIEQDGQAMKQQDLNSIYLEARKVFPKLNYDLFDRTINSNFTPTYDPIVEFIYEHKDRKPTGCIEALFKSIDTDTGMQGSEFCPEYAVIFGKKWMVSIIASIYGDHSPLMMVLCGAKQGTGKTEFWRRLLPKALQCFYAESKLDAGKDDEILMTQKLLIADDEMGGKSKKDEKRLKELLSKQTFSLREPYGRNNVDLQRLAVLCGTTNDNEILSDPTGNRRIIPVNVLSIDHAQYNAVDKIDLFIEAYHLYQSGFEWRLNYDDIRDLNNNTSYFEQTSAERDLISTLFKVPMSEDDPNAEFLTSTEIKSIIEIRTHQKINSTRLGLELRKLGFNRVPLKKNRTTIRGYYVICTKEVAGLSGG